MASPGVSLRVYCISRVFCCKFNVLLFDNSSFVCSHSLCPGRALCSAGTPKGNRERSSRGQGIYNRKINGVVLQFEK